MGSDGTFVEEVAKLWLAPSLLCANIVFGGASAGGFIANAGLQLGGLAVILLLLMNGSFRHWPLPAGKLAKIVLAAAGLMLSQLMPLPPWLWELLPGRERIAEGYQLIGVARPWLPISLTTDGTVAALLSLIPPTAMFMATLASSTAGRRYACIALVGATVASIVLGIMQELHAAPRVYEVTSVKGAVGFFANRNHLGTLCLMAMPFAAAFAVPQRGAELDRAMGRRLAASGVVALMIAGAIAVESMAAWIFLGPMLVGCILVYQRGELGLLPRRTAWIAGSLVALSIVAAVAASLSIGDLSEQASGLKPRERRESIGHTFMASRDYFPLGSGFDSFLAVYPQYEAPENASRSYVNHAHCDYAELLLEGGLPGIALLAMFLLWWIGRFGPVWKRGSAAGTNSRAAFIAVAAPLAHSLVDYPLRTAAVAAATAMACGMLAVSDPERSGSPSRGASRRKSGSGLIMLAPHHRASPNGVAAMR